MFLYSGYELLIMEFYFHKNTYLLDQLYLFSYGSTALSWGSLARFHSGTPHSVGLLWTSDRPEAETLPDNTQH